MFQTVDFILSVQSVLRHFHMHGDKSINVKLWFGVSVVRINEGGIDKRILHSVQLVVKFSTSLQFDCTSKNVLWISEEDTRDCGTSIKSNVTETKARLLYASNNVCVCSCVFACQSMDKRYIFCTFQHCQIKCLISLPRNFDH